MAQVKLGNKKIGILGGTFDPAHYGHVVISKLAKKKYKLNKIIWAITNQNPFKKKTITSIQDRIKLAKKINIKKYGNKNIEFINFNKVNISSSKLRKI